MVFVRIPRHIVEKPRCTQVCISASMMRELGVKRKAAYVSISTRLPWLLAPPKRVFPPRLFSPPRLAYFHLPPLSSRAVVIVVLPALRRGAALTSRRRRSVDPQSLRVSPLSPWASGGPLCITFRPRQRWSHTFLYRQYIHPTRHCLSETNFSHN